MRFFKRLLLLLILCFALSNLYSQDASWMLGTWKGSRYSYASQISSKTIIIDSVYGNNFKGTKTSEADDRNHSSIITSLSGSVDNSLVHVANGKIIYKRDPVGGKWVDCGNCPVESRLTIYKKNLLLTIEISDCQKGCNGLSNYYKPLCSFDSAMQLYLITRFGTQADVDAFKPCDGEEPPPVEEKTDKDSLKNATLIAKKRQQQITDSINNAQSIAKRQQQRTSDSLQTIADAVKKQLQQKLKDSIQNAQNLARNRQQQINDSINAANKKLALVQDSIKTVQAVAAKRQQQINDSLKTVADVAKKRQLQQQQDSIENAQKLARMRQQQVADSMQQAEAFAKKKQQQINDSIAVAKAFALKEQQRINDSVNLAKTSIADSINRARDMALKEQKRITDSINLAKTFAAREQRRISDSASQAKLNAMKRQQQIDDSVRNVVNAAIKKQKQLQQDSIKQAQALAKIKQQQTEDSIKKAQAVAAAASPAANPPAITVSTKKDSAKLVATNNAFNTRTNVLLESYHIATPDILVELFDNAEIDGDKVSVFHNGTLIVNNKTLLKEPITFTIHADTINRQHEFVMVAENLGSIPPNTALMRVTVGKQRYSLGVKTDLSTNAKIVFYYDGN